MFALSKMLGIPCSKRLKKQEQCSKVIGKRGAYSLLDLREPLVRKGPSIRVLLIDAR